MEHASEPGSGPAGTESELLRRWQDAKDPDALDELLRREIRFLRARLEGPSAPGHASPASKDDVAQGGGTDASRVDEALALVATEVARAVGA